MATLIEGDKWYSHLGEERRKGWLLLWKEKSCRLTLEKERRKGRLFLGKERKWYAFLLKVKERYRRFTLGKD